VYETETVEQYGKTFHIIRELQLVDATDVSKYLYGERSKAQQITLQLRHNEKRCVKVRTLGGPQKKWFVTKQGFERALWLVYTLPASDAYDI
jgi:hypothetical protein